MTETVELTYIVGSKQFASRMALADAVAKAKYWHDDV
jgi:hypothetical protein